MKIAGLHKSSLIDYPGKIVSIIFTQGCNFRCPYCHNPSLLPFDNKEQEYLSLPVLYNFLEKRKGLIDGISITGGEPTLQPGLRDFIIQIKAMGLAVKLDTNGSKPEILGELIAEKLVDYIAIDLKFPLNLYYIVTDIKNIGAIISKSINLVKNSGLEYEFRTTVVPGLHRKEEISAIGQLIRGTKRFYIQNFRPTNTYQQDYLHKTPFPDIALEEFKSMLTPLISGVKIRS